MDNTIKARILLAGRRGKTEHKGLCSYHIFNFGNFKLEGREPFGELIAFNEDMLAAECSTLIHIALLQEIFLIPIAGGLEVRRNEEENIYVSAGECGRLQLRAGDTVKITNPYPSQAVDFIQVWLKPGKNTPIPAHAGYSINPFNINTRNAILPLFASSTGATKAYIAKYDLRSKGIFPYSRQIPNLFVYVIEGAFEFQDRLIQEKDSLRFEGVSAEFDFDALSQDAMLLLIETSGN
ncbi:hypothetical protein [Parafilimonas sp.]|uniref:hypothetical protein n=1 Tax=Parafilimonas sp. TaxID=1969739 RepID=UPI0039E358FB